MKVVVGIKSKINSVSKIKNKRACRVYGKLELGESVEVFLFYVVVVMLE